MPNETPDQEKELLSNIVGTMCQYSVWMAQKQVPANLVQAMLNFGNEFSARERFNLSNLAYHAVLGLNDTQPGAHRGEIQEAHEGLRENKRRAMGLP